MRKLGLYSKDVEINKELQELIMTMNQFDWLESSNCCFVNSEKSHCVFYIRYFCDVTKLEVLANILDAAKRDMACRNPDFNLFCQFNFVSGSTGSQFEAPDNAVALELYVQQNVNLRLDAQNTYAEKLMVVAILLEKFQGRCWVESAGDESSKEITKEEIIHLIHKGYKQKEMADYLGISLSNLRSILYELDIDIKKERLKFQRDQNENEDSVTMWAKKIKYKVLDDISLLNEKDKEFIIRLIRKEKLSAKNFARRLGLGITDVYSIQRHLDINIEKEREHNYFRKGRT